MIEESEENPKQENGISNRQVSSTFVSPLTIEQDADFVGLLYKPKEDDEAEYSSMRSAGGIQVNLLIAKHRNGPTGEVPLTFLKGYTRFENAAPVDPGDIPE